MERRKELKEIEEIPAISRPMFYEIIHETENPRDKQIMAMFHLLANRCSEGLAVEAGDVHLEVAVQILDEELMSLQDRLGRLRTEVDVGTSLGRDVSEPRKELGEFFNVYQEMNDLRVKWDRPGQTMETADEIAKRYPQTLVYVVKLITLKRKKRIPRNIPVPVVDPLAPLFVEAVKRESESSLFGITRQRVWQIFKKAGIYSFYKDQGYPVPKNPLRHARLSEVSNVLNRVQLDRFAGWKIKGTADKYIHLRWDDFVGPLVQVARRSPPINVD